MIYSFLLPKAEIQKESCAVCGEDSVHVLAQSFGPETSFAVPDNHVRIIVFGMCDKCFQNKDSLSKDQMIQLIKTLMQQNAEHMQSMMSAINIKP